MPLLLDYSVFNEFLWEQTFQTLQMENKQSLRVEDTLNDDIVAISYSHSQYVDEEFYRVRFGHTV